MYQSVPIQISCAFKELRNENINAPIIIGKTINKVTMSFPNHTAFTNSLSRYKPLKNIPPNEAIADKNIITTESLIGNV